MCVCVRTDYITIRDVSFKKERGRQRERERERDSRITSIKASKNTQQQPRFDGRFLLLFFFLFWFFFPAAVVAPVFIFSPSRSIPFTVFFCEMMMQFSWPVVVSFGLEFQRRRGRRRIVQEQRVLHFHLARLSKKKNRSSLRKQNQTVQKSKRKPRKTREKLSQTKKKPARKEKKTNMKEDVVHDVDMMDVVVTHGCQSGTFVDGVVALFIVLVALDARIGAAPVARRVTARQHDVDVNELFVVVVSLSSYQ